MKELFQMTPKNLPLNHSPLETSPNLNSIDKRLPQMVPTPLVDIIILIVLNSSLILNITSIFGSSKTMSTFYSINCWHHTLNILTHTFQKLRPHQPQLSAASVEPAVLSTTWATISATALVELSNGTTIQMVKQKYSKELSKAKSNMVCQTVMPDTSTISSLTKMR